MLDLYQIPGILLFLIFGVFIIDYCLWWVFKIINKFKKIRFK